MVEKEIKPGRDKPGLARIIRSSALFRERNSIARAVALPTATASVRIFFMRSSGAKGLPFWSPIARS